MTNPENLPSTGFNRNHLAVLVLAVVFTIGGWILLKPVAPNTPIGVGVTPMDHDPSDTFVRNTVINGYNVGSAGTGGSTVCCIALPLRWRPGLTATVKWERCKRNDPINPRPASEVCTWHEKTVEVTEYGRDGMGRVWLHILPQDEVHVIPSGLAPSHPDYPGPGFPKKNFFAKSFGMRHD